MSDALQTLLGDPAVWVVAVAVAGLARVWVTRRIEKGVDSRFALMLEDHRHGLQLVAEAARYEHQVRLTDQSLYATRKHAAASEVYAAFRIAHGLTRSLRGLRRDLTFEEFNADDLRDYMTTWQVPKGQQESILVIWERDKPAGIAELRKYLRMLEQQKAEAKVMEAKNAAYLNELYFSDPAIEAINNLVDELGAWLTYVQLPPQPGEKIPRPKREMLDAALERLHTVLRAELVTQGFALSTITKSQAPDPENEST